MQNKAFAIVNAVMALSYSFIGILLIIYPESNFAQMMLPSNKWAYALGALLIIYGLYRAWRVYEKFRNDDDDDGEEYSYYDGKGG
jgi:sulfite exporter TauE/SafE